MAEFPQNLLKNLIVLILMDKKEKEVQKALGLLKMYDGYVKTQGNTYYDVYEVQDVTLDGAKQQIGKIVAKLQQKSKVLLTLYFVQEYENDDTVLPLKIRRHQINGVRCNIKS